jgi:hypothetical protein
MYVSIKKSRVIKVIKSHFINGLVFFILQLTTNTRRLHRQNRDS